MPLYSGETTANQGAAGTEAWPVTRAASSNGNHTTVPVSTTAGPILAANPARLGATIFNRSGKILYLLLDETGTVSATNFTVQLAANGGYFEVPFDYTGIINGVWSANESGKDAQVTEFV